MPELILEVTSAAVLELDSSTASVLELEVGTPGPPGRDGTSGGGSSGGTQYTQSTPLGTWTITHALGRLPDVAVYLSGGEQVEADVVATNTTVSIAFPTPTSGFAVLT